MIRSANALRAHGFTSGEQVERLSKRQLEAIPNIGESSLDDIRQWAPEDPVFTLAYRRSRELTPNQSCAFPKSISQSF